MTIPSSRSIISLSGAALYCAGSDDETVLLSLRDHTYYGLTNAGSWVWNALIDGPRPIFDLATELAGAFHVDVETATRDLVELSGALLEKGFIELSQ